MSISGSGKEKVSVMANMLKAKNSMDEQLLKHGIGFRSRDKLKSGEMIKNIAVQEKNQKEKWEVDPLKLIVKGLVARGSFGSVFLGDYHGREVAVKVLECGDERLPLNDDLAILREAFIQEVSIWYKLDHPNIVKFIGAATDVPRRLFYINNGKAEQPSLPSNIACVILEYLYGGTLKSYLRKHRDRKIPFKTVIKLALDLARGLSYLHSKKIVHRDLKPDNMLLNKDGTLKITDFGIARAEPSNPTAMTSLAGTHAYMAPEVYNKKAYNRKCDVYSFGICLWQIYCCEVPYSNMRVSEQSTSVVLTEKQRPQIPKCCPKSMAKLMKKCWQTDPEKRPEMSEVVIALEHIDTSKGGGMLPHDRQGGRCLFFCRPKGP